MVSCSSVFGFMGLITSLVACAVCFSTPFWVTTFENERSDGPASGLANAGLWQYCTYPNNTCQVLEDVEQRWFNVVRGLYTGTLVLLILDLLYTICYLTCNCCKSPKAVQVLVLDLLIAVLASLIALLTFGIKTKDHENLPAPLTEGNLHFGWSYYVGVGGLCASVLTLIFYVCEIPNARRVAAYEPIRPTTAS